MANSISLDGIFAIKPSDEIRAFFSRREDGIVPNSYETSWGHDSGKGYILLTQQDVDTLDLNAYNHTLTLKSDQGIVVIQNLMITAVESVYRVPFNSPEDLVLVRVEDFRCFGKFTFVDKSWNAVRRSWMSDTNKRFLVASEDDSVGKDVVVGLWAELPAAIFGASPAEDIGGSYNNVPYPEDLHYRKVNGWWAVCDVANRLGLEVTAKLNGTGVLFSPHDLSALTYSSELGTYSNYLLRSTRTQTPDGMDIPEKFKVLFRKAYTDTVANTDPSVFSAEEDHEFNPFLEVEVSSSSFTAATTVAGTIGILHHDRILVNRDYVLSDYTTLAENMVQSHILSLTQDQEEQVYIHAGFLPFSPQVWNTIIWADYGDGPITMCRLNAFEMKHVNLDYRHRNRTTFGFGQVTTTSTKFNRATNAVSIDGRLKPVQRKTTDGLLDITSTKEMEFASFGDYPVRPCQNIFWMMDTNSSKPIAVPLGLQTNKPLFIKFQIVDPQGAGQGCPNEVAHPSANAYVLDQEWGPTLLGDGLYQRVETSVSGCGANQIILEKGCTGVAYLREDDVYEAMSSSCCAGSGYPEDPDSGVIITETDVRCEQGYLAVYTKNVWIFLTNGVLTRWEYQGWRLSHYAGCCDCGSAPPPPACEGGCMWVWENQDWVYLFDDCEQGVPDCNCNNKPTINGIFEGYILGVPCYNPTSQPPGDGSGSGGSNACTGSCSFRWNADTMTWEAITNNCLEDGGNGAQCQCFPPMENGDMPNQVVWVDCGGGVGV